MQNLLRMRILSALALSGLSLLVVPEPYVVAATSVEDDDEDWSEFETGEDEAAEAAGVQMEEDSTLAENADAALSEPERKLRMALCLGLARQKFSQSADEMQQAVDMMTKMREIEEDEAREMIHVMMIKNCYINFNQETDLGVLSEPNETAWTELVDRLIAPSPKEQKGKQSTLAPRQWELIRQVVDEEKKQKDKKQKPAEKPRIEVVGSNMGAFSKFIYFISVFGAIFGGGYFLVKRLMETERAPKRHGSRKHSKENKENKEANKDASKELKKD